MNAVYFFFEILRTFAAVAAAASIGVALRQYLLAQRAWRDAHERARREKAVSIIQEFTKAYNRQWAAVSKLIERLDDDTLRKLDKGEPFDVKAELIDLLIAAIPTVLGDALKQVDGEPVRLDARQVFALQWEAITFLNAVEVVFEAWCSDVASSHIIERQMRPIYNPEQSRTILRRFREITGGITVFPCIDAFVRFIDPPKQPSAKPIGGTVT